MYCKNCGTVIPDDASFCESCGSPLTEIKEPQQTKTVEKNNTLPKEKAGCTVLSVILCIIIVLLGSFSSIIFLTRHAVNE